MKILGTGLSGLVGSRIVELTSDIWFFENLSLETGVDITNKETLATYFHNCDAPWVFHFAAYTNVQEAEKEKPMGTLSTAWKVNVAATENIAEMCRQTNKHLVYLDTDYAFDGKERSYSEDNTHYPLGWYAITKYEGAKRVLSLGENGLVARIANPYRAHPVGKQDFVHKMIDMFQQRKEVLGATDQLFVPTFIDDIARALRVLIEGSYHGLYHVVGSDALNPYHAALTVAETFGFPKSLVKPTTFDRMFSGRAPIPQYADLKNDKIHSLGVEMKTFAQGLNEVKSQELQVKKV